MTYLLDGKRSKLADALQSHYKIPVHETTSANIKHIISARAGTIKL